MCWHHWQCTTWPTGTPRSPGSTATEAISKAGFVIDRLLEPTPLPELKEREPDTYRRLTTTPGLLLFRLTKPTPTA
jgi:hypothetical protein